MQLRSPVEYRAPIFTRPLLDAHKEMHMPMGPLCVLVLSKWTQNHSLSFVKVKEKTILSKVEKYFSKIEKGRAMIFSR